MEEIYIIICLKQRNKNEKNTKINYRDSKKNQRRNLNLVISTSIK